MKSCEWKPHRGIFEFKILGTWRLQSVLNGINLTFTVCSKRYKFNVLHMYNSSLNCIEEGIFRISAFFLKQKNW